MDGRILELSALVAAKGAFLRETLDAMARCPSGRPRHKMDGNAGTGPLVLLSAPRHPGLTGRVVPIDLRLGDGYAALVVAGRAGGKTVALRSLGLLSLIARPACPAESGSVLPVFTDVRGHRR